MKSKLLLPVIPAPRRGRYRADRPIRVGASPRTSNSEAVTLYGCMDCQWLDHMVSFWAGHAPRQSQSYVRLRVAHFAAAHGGTR